MPTNDTSSQHQRRMFRGRGRPRHRAPHKKAATTTAATTTTATTTQPPRVRSSRRRTTPADAAENSDSEGRLYHLDSSHLENNHDNDYYSSSSGEEASGETDSAAAATDTDTTLLLGPTTTTTRDDENDNTNDNNDNDNDDDGDTSLPAVAETEMMTATLPPPLPPPVESSLVVLSSSCNTALRHEMTHLRQRIANISTAFGSVTMADPKTYQTNVLNAVLNAVHEWRHMVKQYYGGAMTVADARRGGQWVYGVVQASLQTGPLQGGKPAYFRRCGSVVAAMVHEYLLKICSTAAAAVSELQWTEKQAAAWQTWTRKAAQAAIVAGEEPSPSNQKQVRYAMQKKHAKQQKRQAKKKQLGLA